MGMYTELVLGLELEPDEKVLNVLKYMLGDIEEKPLDYGYSHSLFETARWDLMLRCDSYYFDGQTDSKLIFDRHGYVYLNVRCNFKNYSNEIELFLDWLKPYIKTDGFLGYTRYEEDYDPTLIYKEGRQIKYNFNGKHWYE